MSTNKYARTYFYWLYFPANTLLDISSENDGCKYCIEKQIQQPCNNVTLHYCDELGIDRVNKLHPKHSEAQVDCNIGNAGEHRVAK